MTAETEMTTGNCDVCEREYDTASSLDHCAEEGLCWEHCTDYLAHVSPSIYDEGERTPVAITDKLTALRGAIDAESISMGELIELQNLAPWIEPGDVQLAEWANVPEQTFTRHAGDARPVTYTDAEMEKDRAEERGEFPDADGQYVIYSASEAEADADIGKARGYWSNDAGWTVLTDASVFPDTTGNLPYPEDAQWVRLPRLAVTA